MNKDAFLITEKRPLVIHEAQKSALHHRKWKMIKFFHGSLSAFIHKLKCFT